MDAIQKNVMRPVKSSKTFEQLSEEILADNDIATFIKEHGMTEDQIGLSISKFFEYKTERDKLLKQDASYIAEGYQPVLIMNEGYADVVYRETPELVEYRQQEAIRNRIQLMNLPESLRHISSSDLDFEDEFRFEVYQALEQFVQSYPQNSQGLYIFGRFGIGKSYLMAYLAQRLSKTHGLSTILVHYPTFVVDIKNAIKDGSVKDKIDELKTAQVLVLDDIGAEQHSPWVRDDVLQVILQHRMQENLPTFFTSNFSFADLERHFATGKSGDETWQAQRVMERIRYLAKETYLEGKNRRHV